MLGNASKDVSRWRRSTSAQAGDAWVAAERGCAQVSDGIPREPAASARLEEAAAHDVPAQGILAVAGGRHGPGAAAGRAGAALAAVGVGEGRHNGVRAWGRGGGGFMPAACWRLCLLQLTEQRQIQTEQASSGGAPSAVRMSPPARSVSNSYVQLAAGAPCVVPLTMPGEGVATQSVAFCGSRGSAAGSAAWLNLGVCTAVCWQHGGTPAHTHSRG